MGEGGYAKGKLGGCYKNGGDISYEQLNTYEHDKMSGHKKSPPIMMGTMLINILLVS
jgi:hypothetical protein